MNKLLIIDSDVAATQMVQNSLSSAHIDIRATADGAEGLQLAHSERFDCVILCVELARGSGYSVCNKLRKDPQIADLPLILTSSDATEETFEQHKKLKTRADHYLKKPYDAEELRRILGHYLSLDGQSHEEPRRLRPHEVESTQALDAVTAFTSLPEEATVVFAQAPARYTHKPAPTPTTVSEVAAPADVGTLDLRGAESLGADARDEATRVVRRDTLKIALAPDADEALRPAQAAMHDEETQAFAEQTPIVRISEAQAYHPTVRASVPGTAARPQSGRDTAVQIGQPRAAFEVLPDADAESRAQNSYAAVALATQQAADRAAPNDAAQSAPARAVPAANPPRALATPQAQSVDTLRQEIRGLRQKVQDLERALEAAEVSYSERLVTESKRGNESVDLKKKIVSLEREALKVQDRAQKQQSDWDATRAELAAARTAIAEGQRSHSELLRQHEALTAEHTALQASHAEVIGQMRALQTAHDSLQAGHAGTLAAWQRARQAVDNTLELIDTTGFLTPV